MSNKIFRITFSIINKMLLGAVGGGTLLGIIFVLIAQQPHQIIVVAAVAGAVTGAVIWPIATGIYKIVGTALSGLTVITIAALIGAFVGVITARLTGLLICGLFGAFAVISFWILINRLASKTVIKHNL